MRLQNHTLPNRELVLEFHGKTISTDEEHVSDAINIATEELAGHGKGISNNPLTLLVRKNGVPDLTMVDLHGITCVPVHGQPENIYDQIKDMIMEYIKPEESIILNVLAAIVDFTTCESIRMSQSVDKTGLRALAVVTKADKSPKGLLEIVTVDDVNIGLAYVFVRNCIGDESQEDARMVEQTLFESHPLLSKIDKSIFGIPVLAQKLVLVQVQAVIISKTLPEIVKKINEKLANNLTELGKLPTNLASVAEAMTAFMHIIGLTKESLRKILLRGEFDEYPEDKKMHCTARLVEMLDSYSCDLYTCAESDATKNFLIKEIKVLEEAKLIGFPNFMPHTAFLSILQGKVKGIAKMPIGFVENVWNYLEDVLMNVLNCHSENYYQLLMFTRRAGQVLIAKKKQSSIKHVLAIEMEKHTDYTCNHEFVQEYNRLISLQEIFVNEVLNNEQKPTHVNLEGVGNIDVGHLRQYPSVLTLAFDLKVRMKSYWKIVQKRFIDTISLHLMLSINNLVDHDLEMDMVHDMLSPSGGGIERLLEESPSISGEREKLQRSVKIPKARTLSQTSLFFMTQHVNSIPRTYFLIPLNQATYDAPSNYFLLANRAFWEEPVVLISSMKR